MSAKEEEIAKLETEYVEFRDLVAHLPAEAFERGGLGDWTLAQLLAHMAGWFREMTPAFDRVARGEPARPVDVDYRDADAWKAKFVEHTKVGADALDDFDIAFHDYYAAAKGLDEEFYGVDAETGRAKIGNRLLDGAGHTHFHEHKPAIQAWLQNVQV